jgi:iron complex outermembrane recepter protein
VFYRYVDNYIQGTASTNQAAVMFVRMMNMMNGTSNPDPLEFNNVDARLYGFDLDWRYQLTQRWALSGVVNYVRGEREDSSDNLYRIPPLNGFVAVDYQRADWGLTLETFAYADQDEVSQVNQETKSDGYLLFNVSGHWNFHPAARISAGVDNLADNNYVDHLGGVNRVMGNPDIAVGERLPGYGRNFFARLDLQF